MNELKNFKEKKLAEFQKEFNNMELCFEATNGDLLDLSEIKQFISDLIDEMEKAIPAKSDETNLIGSVGHNHCIEEFLTNLNS